MSTDHGATIVNLNLLQADRFRGLLESQCSGGEECRLHDALERFARGKVSCIVIVPATPSSVGRAESVAEARDPQGDSSP